MLKKNKHWLWRIVSGVLIISLSLSGFSVGQLIVSASELAGYQDEAIVCIKNVGSGNYLNVHYGQDQNEVNVYQWTWDGSDEQQFKLRYNLEEDCYLIGAMCSSDGNGRVLDIVKKSGQVQNGCNVQIYNATDPVAQQWQFAYQGNGRFTIFPVSNIYTVLTACGNSNGSGNGTSATDAGNVYLSEIPMASSVDYNEYQMWEIEEVNPEAILEDGLYNIVCDNSFRMAVDVNTWNVVQRKKGNYEEQIWDITCVWNEYYIIKPYVNESKMLSVAGDADGEGTNITAAQDYNHNSQLNANALWKIVPNADGGYRIVLKASYNNQVASVLYSDTVEGTNIVELPYYGARGQRWQFKKPSYSCSQNPDDVDVHNLTFNASTKEYQCMRCSATFLTPQEEDYTLLLEEDLLTVFALQRAARMLELTQTKATSVEACYKMTDIIRNKDIYVDEHRYQYSNREGECLPSISYVSSASTMDTKISICTHEIDLGNIIGHDLIWSVDEILPFPCNHFMEDLQQSISGAMDEDEQYSTSEVYSIALEIMLNIYGEGPIVSTLSKIITAVEFSKSYVMASNARQYQVGDICVQIDLNNGSAHDTYIGYFHITGSGNNKRIHIIDEVMHTRDRNSTPVPNTYSYEHYSTAQENAPMILEEGTLF